MVQNRKAPGDQSVLGIPPGWVRRVIDRAFRNGKLIPRIASQVRLIDAGRSWATFYPDIIHTDPPPLTIVPDLDQDDGAYLFDDTKQELFFGHTSTPLDWAIGTNITPYFWWSPDDATAGNVVWEFGYTLAANGEVFTPGDFTTQSITVAAPGTQYEISREAFTSLDFSAATGEGVFNWYLMRDATNAADTYAADARLYTFEFRYLRDGFGSATIGSKT